MRKILLYRSVLQAFLPAHEKNVRQQTWGQVYRDPGIKWEKIASIKPPPGIAALYSLRITQSRRASAYRGGDYMRLLTIAPDHA